MPASSRCSLPVVGTQTVFTSKRIFVAGDVLVVSPEKDPLVQVLMLVSRAASTPLALSARSVTMCYHRGKDPQPIGLMPFRGLK